MLDVDEEDSSREFIVVRDVFLRQLALQSLEADRFDEGHVRRSCGGRRGGKVGGGKKGRRKEKARARRTRAKNWRAEKFLRASSPPRLKKESQMMMMMNDER